MKKRAFGKLYKKLFYIPKHEKLTEKVFRCRMITSLLTMLACIAVLITSTWAWFTMNVTTQTTTVASAYYSVSVDKAENGVYICPLTYEDKHEFVITASGTATTGYCKIQVGESTYYTEQIAQGQSLDLTVYAAKDTVITFTPGWGTLSNFTDESPKNPINHSTTPSTTYTVEPTARLSSIAAHYGVTEEDILIYNNLLAATVAEESTTTLLPVGMDLKIPNPAENVEPYKVPYATYTVEATATLKDISEYHDVSVENILAYNSITELTEGFTLKIPGVAQDIEPYKAPVIEQTISSVSKLESIDKKDSQSLTSSEALSGDGLAKTEQISGTQSVGDVKSPDVEDELITDLKTEEPDTTGETNETDTTEAAEEPEVIDTTVEDSSEVAEDAADDSTEVQDDNTEVETETETETEAVDDTEAQTETMTETEVESETETESEEETETEPETDTDTTEESPEIKEE